MDKIAIIGLGLIGGSIGLALKQQKRSDLQVVGFDIEVDTGNKAARKGAVDKATWSIQEAVEGARIVIVATPVLNIRETFETIAPMLAPQTIVTDTGGTKTAVMEWAKEYLPDTVSFIGGDPLAGKGMSGIDNASADLFSGQSYALVPSPSANPAAVDAIVTLTETMRATPYFVDAVEHDSYTAAVGHLPILLAEALVGATAKSPAWKEMGRMASTSYESASSLAAVDPIVNLDICITNRDSITHWINEAIRELMRFRDLVDNAKDEDGAEALGNALALSWQNREVWHAKYITGDFSESENRSKVNVGEVFMDFMVGTKLRERYQQLFSLNSKKSEERQRRRFRRV